MLYVPIVKWFTEGASCVVHSIVPIVIATLPGGRVVHEDYGVLLNRIRDKRDTERRLERCNDAMTLLSTVDFPDKMAAGPSGFNSLVTN